MEISGHDKFLVGILDLRTSIEQTARYAVEAHKLHALGRDNDEIISKLLETVNAINTTSKEMLEVWPEFRDHI